MHFLKLTILKLKVTFAFYFSYLLNPRALHEGLIDAERVAKRELARKNADLLKLGVRIRACSVPQAQPIDIFPVFKQCKLLKEEVEITRKAILVADAALSMPELLELLIESGAAVRLTEVA